MGEDFSEKYDSLSKLILKTTNAKMIERPDATELVKSIEEEIKMLENEIIMFDKKKSFDMDTETIQCDSSTTISFEQQYQPRELDLINSNRLVKSISVDIIEFDFECISTHCHLDFCRIYLLSIRNL